MRKLLTTITALMATIAMFAQNVDTSGWKSGDDVTEDLQIGDYDGTFSGNKAANGNGDYTPSDNGAYWKGTTLSEWNYEESLGCGAYAFYFDGKATGDLTDIYQLVYFPAGYYTIEVQALYREGTPYDSFVSFFGGTTKKNAWLYANILTGNDAESSVTRSYTKVVRSIASSEQTGSRIHEAGDWKNDAEYGYRDPETGTTVNYYCPACLVGAIKYFAAGKYQNTMNIVLEEGAYIRLGLKKTANIAQDWLVFTNLHVIYNGPADESAMLAMAIEEYNTASENIESIKDNIASQGFGALSELIFDEQAAIDDEVDLTSLESVVAGTDKMNALYDKANNALQIAYRLTELLEMSADMLASTDFPGKSAFQSVYDDVTRKATTEDPEEINYDMNSYTEMFNELSKARADYLNTGDVDENGAKDFTALIKHPWFVNPEYTPSYINGAWQLTADGWVDGMNQDNYSNVKNGRTDIASKVVLSADEDVTNQWYKYVNYSAGWSAGLNLYYQGHLIGVSDGWNSGLTGTQEIRQQLVGLPNGYYSLKGLVRGNGSGDWNDNNLPPYHNIFAQNSDEVVVKSPVGHTDSYVAPQYGWYEWQPTTWVEHKTSIIQVSDGRLLIGGQTSMVGNFTGFRLMYYGENPAFNEMIQEEIDEVTKQMNEKLTFAGDIKHVTDLLATIQLPLGSAAAYEEALATTRVALDYINAAYNVMRNYNAPNGYDEMFGKYDADSPQSGILLPAMIFISELGTKETDVYTAATEAMEVYNAYKSYMGYYDRALTYEDAELKLAIDEQTAALSAKYSDVETLKAYSTALNLLINVALIKDAGGNTASESNPVNITSLLVNPDFSQGPTTGWSGTGATTNEYARGNAEIWNASSIDMYQTIAGLPEGTYEIRVRALYRDARNARDNDHASWTSFWTEANGDPALWKNHNAELYAKTATAEEATYVTSVCDGKFTEPSFDRYIGQLIEGDLLLDENGDPVFDENGNEIVQYDTIWTYFTDKTLDNFYPFDETIIVDEGTYYYPSSMYGAYCRFLLSPEAYNNKVTITIAQGEDLRIGFRKSVHIEGDWLIFDDFELYFLGGKLETGIQAVENATAKSGAIYNVAGQRVNNVSKGIYIQNGKKVFVK